MEDPLQGTLSPEPGTHSLPQLTEFEDVIAVEWLVLRTLVGVQYAAAVRAGVLHVFAGFDEKWNQSKWKETGENDERNGNTNRFVQH